MKHKRKSSITLPPQELQRVLNLKKRLKLKSNVEVIRRSLQLLGETFERESLRRQYLEASLKTRVVTNAEISELDHLSSEAIE